MADQDDDKTEDEGGDGSPHLEGEEQDQASAHAPLRAKVIHEVIAEEGRAELKRPASALVWSGLAAGLSMGFSFLAQAMLRSGLPDAPWRPLVDSFGYALGFLIVIMGRQQLFTESTLSAVLPVLTKRNGETLLACLRLWAIVLAANLVGTVIFSAVVANTDLFRPDVVTALTEMSKEPYAGSFLQTAGRGIFAGWLIALTAWLLPNSGSARPIIIVLLTYVVGLAHLSHIIAGSAEAAFGVMKGHATWIQYFTVFVVPTVLGNTIGGVALVAMLNHAPVSSELEGDSSSGEQGKA
jgi:formate/nitrite transporter FocA (FNT family)